MTIEIPVWVLWLLGIPLGLVAGVLMILGVVFVVYASSMQVWK